MEMSICGSDCSECYCYGEMCQGCNACQGKVFYCGGEECAIYHCCVTEHEFADCHECGKLPCRIWQENRDPKYSDEEFEALLDGKIENLRRKFESSFQTTNS